MSADHVWLVALKVFLIALEKYCVFFASTKVVFARRVEAVTLVGHRWFTVNSMPPNSFPAFKKAPSVPEIT